MAIKIRFKKSTSFLGLKRLPKDIKKNFSKELKAEIADIIIDFILQGKSPVKGRSGIFRWRRYNRQYAKWKRGSASATQPVDMLVTGKMLQSLRAKSTKSGGVRISFEDRVAAYHDIEGAGINRIKRRLLPRRRGEEFRKEIDRAIGKILERAVKKSVARQ